MEIDSKSFREWLAREYVEGKPLFYLFDKIRVRTELLKTQAIQKGDTEHIKGQAQGCQWASELPISLLQQLTPSDTDTEKQ